MLQITEKIGVIIVAAGRGTRAASITNGPKQYELIAGKTVLQHTLDAFLKIQEIKTKILFQIVIHRDDKELYLQAIKQIQNTHPDNFLPPVLGGNSRQESVFEGLKALAVISDETPINHILIHDAARPFVSEKIILSLLQSLEHNEAALPLLPIYDTVKRHDGTKLIGTEDRSSLALAQTPQAFKLKTIFKLHQKAAKCDITFTDDASIAEHFNIAVKIVEGHANNYKLTSREDMLNAQQELTKSWEGNSKLHSPDIRVGTAYDVHRCKPDTQITLCGLTFPSPVSLIGHSDADVALHALTDAVLGALAQGDIGSHFPPSDEKWRAAESSQFLIHALNLARSRNAKITMLDVTIICEHPKIGPHRDAMRSKIAEITGLEMERIAVKATTNESLGFIGREEGIAALASATLVFHEADI